MPPSFDFPDSPVVGEEYTPADATFVWSGKVWSVKKPVERHGIEDVPPFPAGEVYGRSVNRWVPLDTTDMSLRIAGVGLDNVGPLVNLQPANMDNEIGGVKVLLRSPLNGLAYDSTFTITAPLATDILAGTLVEPPNDGMQYVRMRANDLSAWVQASGASIGPTPPIAPVPGSLWWRNDPDGELYIYYTDPTSSQWVPAVKPPGSPIYAGDDPPTSPMANQLWWESDTGALLIWFDDGTSSQWVQVVGGSAGDAAIDFLPLTGGTLSGALLLPTARPQWPEEAAHKSYVDQTVAESALYQGVWQVAANTPDLNTVTKLNAYSWIAQTAVATTPEAAPAGIPGIGGLMIGSGDTIKWNEALAIYEQIKVAGAAGNFVPIAGGTMTGALIAPSVEIQGTTHAASTVRLFPSAPPNGGRIDFQTADGATRKGYIGYGSDTDLVLHAETGMTWRVSGGLGFGSVAATTATDLSNHIALFGTTFGFSITSGTLNYVVPAANFHKFLVGGAVKIQIDSNGCRIGTSAVGDGFYIGDAWHGMYFNGSNTLVFTEYHDRFEWRRQVSGTAQGGDLRMSLYGGNLSVSGEITVTGMSNLGHVQSSSHIEAVQNVYALSFIQNSTNRSVFDEIDRIAPVVTEVALLRDEVAVLRAQLARLRENPVAFDFPDAPTQDQEYSLGGIAYIFDGEVWRTKAGPAYVAKTGDIMSGALDLPAILPTLTTQATHKGYVDQTIAAASLYQGPWFVASNNPDLIAEAATALHTYSWTAQTVDKDIPEICPPGVPGIEGENIGAGDSVVWNANTSQYDLIQQPASTAGYVPLVGGTMTGTLQINTGVTHSIILADGAGVGGTMKLSASSGTHAGIIEFFDPNGTTRRGYIGYGDTAGLNLNAECGRWVINGDLYMQDGVGIHWGSTSAVASVTDFSEGICLYGYGGTSQFGLNITSGTLNITVQNTGNLIAFNVGTEQVVNIKNDGVRIPGGNLSVTGNISATGTISSGVGNGAVGLQLNDGGRIDLSSGCLIYKNYGSNDFMFHTNSNQVFTFHISGTGDVFVIDTIGSTGNLSIPGRGALAVREEVDVVIDGLRAELTALRAEIAELRGR